MCRMWTCLPPADMVEIWTENGGMVVRGHIESIMWMQLVEKTKNREIDHNIAVFFKKKWANVR